MGVRARGSAHTQRRRSAGVGPVAASHDAGRRKPVRSGGCAASGSKEPKWRRAELVSHQRRRAHTSRGTSGGHRWRGLGLGGVQEKETKERSCRAATLPLAVAIGMKAGIGVRGWGDKGLVKWGQRHGGT